MNQETIAEIFQIEQDAVTVHDRAQRQAEQMIAEAEQAASVLREQAITAVNREVESILTAGRQAAEEERQRIMQAAEIEVAREAERAALHSEDAIHFVLRRIAGRT
ncbi:MAG: hypothetical protein JXB35_02450 [Anaerolineae bacterium]|nr:hypothetical protein [Anaerolineae bacterium]